MSEPTQSIIDTRSHQMFPDLEPAEIERVRRFGEVRSFGARRGAGQGRRRGPRPDHHLGRRGRHHPARQIGPPRANRHPWPRRVHGRTGPAGGPAGSGGRLRAGTGGGLDHPAGPAPGVAGGRGGTRRADHARSDPASRRPARDGSRRAGDRRRAPRTAMCFGSKAFSHATAIRIKG